MRAVAASLDWSLAWTGLAWTLSTVQSATCTEARCRART